MNVERTIPDLRALWVHQASRIKDFMIRIQISSHGVRAEDWNQPETGVVTAQFSDSLSTNLPSWRRKDHLSSFHTRSAQPSES